MKGRQRGRNGGGGGGGGGGGKPRPPGRNPNFDGGGNNRPRGNAQQLMEKYLALARDATTAGDRVLAENYFQHADHYYRVLNARFEQQNNNGQRRFEGGQGGQNQHYDNRQGYGNDRPYDGDYQQHGPGGGYQQQPQHQPQQQPPQQQPQQHHNPAPEPEPQQAHDAEIALPPGILGDAPLEGASEPQEAEGQQESGDQPRSRDRGRRRRGRSDRPAAGAAGE